MLGAAAAARRAGRVALAGGRAREHRAAGAVEVAGQDVEHVDQPGGERAELLRRRADAAVDRGRARRRRARAPCAGSRRRRSRSRGATASGVNGCASSRDRRRSRRSSPASRPGRTSPSANSTWTSANSSCASVPGRIGWCSSAASAVRLRRGSTTTSLPPRARSAFSRPRMSGAVISEPLEASGLAPSISRCCVRSTSGIGDRQRRAVHQRAGDLLRPLVDRAGGEDAARAERLQQHAAVEQRGEPVRRRVADVDGDRVAAVRLDQRRRAARR